MLRIYLFNYSVFVVVGVVVRCLFCAHTAKVIPLTISCTYIKFVEINEFCSLFDGVLFTLQYLYLLFERKKVQQSNDWGKKTPFLKNFNLLEWFSVVGFFELDIFHFFMYSSLLLRLLVAWHYLWRKMLEFSYIFVMVLLCSWTHLCHRYTNETSTPSFSVNWLLNSVFWALCACAHIHHMVINFTLIRIYVRIFSTWYEQLILWNVKTIRIFFPFSLFFLHIYLILFSFAFFSVFISSLNWTISSFYGSFFYF